MRQGSASLLSTITTEYITRSHDWLMQANRQAHEKACAAFYNRRTGWTNYLIKNIIFEYADHQVQNVAPIVHIFRSVIPAKPALPQDAAGQTAFFSKLRTDLKSLFATKLRQPITDEEIDNIIDIFQNPDKGCATKIATIINPERILALAVVIIFVQKHADDVEAFLAAKTIIDTAPCIGKDFFKAIYDKYCRELKPIYDDIQQQHKKAANLLKEKISNAAVRTTINNEVLNIVKEYLDTYPVLTHAIKSYNEIYTAEIAELIPRQKELTEALNKIENLLGHERSRNAASEANFDWGAAESYGVNNFDEASAKEAYEREITENIQRLHAEEEKIRVNLIRCQADINDRIAAAYRTAAERTGLDPTHQRLWQCYREACATRDLSAQDALSEQMLSLMVEVSEKNTDLFQGRIRSACEGLFVDAAPIMASLTPADKSDSKEKTAGASVPSAPVITGSAVAAGGAGASSDPIIAAAMHAASAVGALYSAPTPSASVITAIGADAAGLADEDPVAPSPRREPSQLGIPDAHTDSKNTHATDRPIAVSTFTIVAAAPNLIGIAEAPISRDATPVFDAHSLPSVPAMVPASGRETEDSTALPVAT